MTVFYGGVKPSMGGNAFFTFVFAVVLVTQVVQGIRYRQWFFMVAWFIGSILEITGYTGRILSRKDLTSLSHYIMQSSSITLAPIFYLAAIYYLLAQLIVIMGPKFSRMRPIYYTVIFMLCDIIALCVQGYGGYKSTSSDGAETGKWIMVGGLIFQLVSITVFQVLYYDFLYRVYREEKYYGGRGFNSEYIHVRLHKFFKPLLLAIPFSVLLIYIRSIYRVAESAQGSMGKLTVDESYVFGLESAMLGIATCLLSIIYPGMVYGKGTKIGVKKKQDTQYESNEYQSNDELNNLSYNYPGIKREIV